MSHGSSQQAYSYEKALWHTRKIEALRRGEQIVPSQIQLIISDLCSHSCLVSGTMIDTPRGQLAIETIRPGDAVIAPNGQEVLVTQSSWRVSEDLYEISIGGRRLYATDDHPILVRSGWKRADQCCPGESALVRLRVWEPRQAESERRMVPNTQRASTHNGKGASDGPPIKDRPGVSSRAAMSVWLWRAGDAVQDDREALVRFSQGTHLEYRAEAVEKTWQASASVRKRPAVRRNAATLHLRLWEPCQVEQSVFEMGQISQRSFADGREDAVCNSPRTVTASHRQEPATSLPLWLRTTREPLQAYCRDLLGGLRVWTPSHREDGAHLSRSAGEDVGAHESRQPYATAWDCRKGEALCVSGLQPVEIGTTIRCVCDLARAPNRLHRQWQLLDRPEKSRFQGSAPTQGDRDYLKRDFQRPFDRAKNAYGVRVDGGQACQTTRPSVSGCLLSPRQSPEVTDSAATGSGRICIEGLTIQRGMGWAPIDSIRRIPGRYRVYSLTCDPVDSFIANGIAVHNCSFCAYRRPDGLSSEHFGIYEGGILNRNPNRMIPPEKVKEILEDCAALGVKACQYTGGGEPTVHPQCIELFQYAQDLGLETALVTHGNILRLGWEEVYCRMAWIRVSIDAGSPATYASTRRVHASFFDKVLANMSRIRHAIDAVHSSCLLGIGYVVTLENWAELVQGVKLAKEHGAMNVRLSAMFSKAGASYYGDALAAIRWEILKAKELADDTFQVIDLFGDRIEDLEQHAPDYSRCSYQEFNMYIGGDQKVYRCCTTAYTAHGEVGDLRHQRLRDWFASEQKRRAYGDFKASSCQVCQFNGKNRAILYAIDPAPLHVNFV